MNFPPNFFSSEFFKSGKKKLLIKRVIGLPGETVSYKDGQLYINGKAMDEPFLNQDYVNTYEDGTFMSDVDPITLGDDEYFCLGDNRPHSSDSRYYGPFKKDDIIDPAVGLVMKVRCGAQVKKGDTLCTLYVNDDKNLAEVERMLQDAIHIAPQKPEPFKMVYGVFTD